MSDADLRELERRFRASGSVDDEAAWLKGCLVAGERTADELRLLAYEGDEAARRALGDWKNDTLWLLARAAQQRAERAARLAAAREEAARRGKEPFDMAALAEIYEFRSPEVSENHALYAWELEEQYYVVYPALMSLAEFAALRRRLDPWA